MEWEPVNLEYIEWFDHVSLGDEWEDIDKAAAEKLAPLVCRSVGWVVAEDARAVKLVANLDGEPDTADHGFGMFVILKAAIKRRRKLNV